MDQQQPQKQVVTNAMRAQQFDQMQQQQQMSQNVTANKVPTSLSSKNNNNSFKKQQSLPVQQQQSQQNLQQSQNIGFFQSLKNRFSNVFGSSDDSKIQQPSNLQSQQQFQTQQIEKDYPVKNSGMKYDDDEEIIAQEINNIVKQNKKAYDFLANLEFTIKSKNKTLQINSKDSQLIPAMISLKVKEQEDDDNIRSGIDLICVVDRSGSMAGKKIQLVKQTLEVLLNFLKEQDRLCIIEFDDRANRQFQQNSYFLSRLTPLICVTKKNKPFFLSKISQLQQRGGTNITLGMEQAFKQIQDRKYKNTVSSVFLLSDGQDKSAQLKVHNFLNTHQLEAFTIYSFGFGSDHDPELMTSICKLKDGNFYYIQELSMLDECFVDALGGLQSVVATNIEINLYCQPIEPFHQIYISQTYGDAFKEIEKNRQWRITQQQLISGVSKDFIVELNIPAMKQKIIRSTIIKEMFNYQQLLFEQLKLKIKKSQLQRHLYPVLFIMKMKSFNFQMMTSKQIFNQNYNRDVVINYFRVKGAQYIDDARRACDEGQFQKGEQQLDQLLVQLNQNQKIQSKAVHIIRDLEQAKEVCKPNKFQSYGRQQMYQMNNCHINQVSQPQQFNLQSQKEQEELFNQQLQSNTGIIIQNAYGNKKQGTMQAIQKLSKRS